MQQQFDFRIGERRLTHLFKEVGPNLKIMGEDMKDVVQEAIQDRDPIKIGMAPLVIAGEIWFQLSDRVLAGIVDKRVEQVQGSETLHDISGIGKHLAKAELAKAAVTVLKLPGDFAMDALKGIGGFKGRTRAKIEHTLAA